MHPTVVSIIDGAKEGNAVGKKHIKTIVDEFNKKVREKKKAELAKEVKPKKPKKTVQKKTVLTSKVSEISTTNLSAFKTIVIKDEMRPAMQGVFFDKENNAIVATDARKMLIVYDAKVGKQGIINPKNGQEIDAKFPNWHEVVPLNTKGVENISVTELIDKTSDLAKENKKIKYERDKKIVTYEIGGDVFGFDPLILNEGLLALKSLGYEDVTMTFSQPNRATIFHTKDGKVDLLVMPVMVGENIESDRVTSFGSLKAEDLTIKNNIIAEKQVDRILDGEKGYGALNRLRSYRESIKEGSKFSAKYDANKVVEYAYDELETLSKIEDVYSDNATISKKIKEAKKQLNDAISEVAPTVKENGGTLEKSAYEPDFTQEITEEQLIEWNDAFKNGTTTEQYRAVQEFIAKAWNATTGKEVKDLVKASKKY